MTPPIATSSPPPIRCPARLTIFRHRCVTVSSLNLCAVLITPTPIRGPPAFAHHVAITRDWIQTLFLRFVPPSQSHSFGSRYGAVEWLRTRGLAWVQDGDVETDNGPDRRTCVLVSRSPELQSGGGEVWAEDVQRVPSRSGVSGAEAYGGMCGVLEASAPLTHTSCPARTCGAWHMVCRMGLTIVAPAWGVSPLVRTTAMDHGPTLFGLVARRSRIPPGRTNERGSIHRPPDGGAVHGSAADGLGMSTKPACSQVPNVNVHVGVVGSGDAGPGAREQENNSGARAHEHERRKFAIVADGRMV